MRASVGFIFLLGFIGQARGEDGWLKKVSSVYLDSNGGRRVSRGERYLYKIALKAMQRGDAMDKLDFFCICVGEMRSGSAGWAERVGRWE